MSSGDQLFHQALAALNAGRFSNAESLFRAFLAIQPEHVAALNLITVALMRMERYADAGEFIAKAVSLNQTSDVSYYNYGLILKRLNEPQQALQQFNHAIRLNARVPETWNNRGTVRNDLWQYEKAIDDFDQAILLNADYAAAYCNRGKSFFGLGHYNAALHSYEKALALRPNLSEAWIGRGITFVQLKRNDEAFAAFAKAISLNPNSAEAWSDLGHGFLELGRYDEAFVAYDKAIVLNPALEAIAGNRLYSKLQLCDWTNLATDVAKVLTDLRAGKPAIVPYHLLPIPSSSDDQLRCAKSYAAHRPTYAPLWRGQIYHHDRIRIAYLSSDFGEHPVGFLIPGLFEHHNRSHFETTAISLGTAQNSNLYRRIVASADRFIDCHEHGAGEIAGLLREQEIEIAVDLNGCTRGGRIDVFAQRAAPIQVNYLGYAGTMGAEYYDYIVADRIVIPQEQFSFFQEKVVWLPDSFLVNDDKRQVASQIPSRTELRLPDTGFVFCCFNQSVKIDPCIFDIWMRLLRSIDGSVLWLKKNHSVASHNLRAEAESRGVAPERLVFAERLEFMDEHLARYVQADLFLDTLNYNAHATASDALWAGVPVLTCAGSTFAGRVAASLLHAIGLPELVTESLADYEGLALKLAQDPPLLNSLKKKLLENRSNFPLFDTGRFTRHIEAAYTKMWQSYRRGEKPQHVCVDAA
jgi:protein O-GlcNAc transferase